MHFSTKNAHSDQVRGKSPDTVELNEPVGVVSMTNVNNNSSTKTGKTPSVGSKRAADIKISQPSCSKRGKLTQLANKKATTDKTNKPKVKRNSKAKVLVQQTLKSSQDSDQDSSDQEVEQVFEEEGNMMKMKVQADEDNFTGPSEEEGKIDDDSDTENETESEAECSEFESGASSGNENAEIDQNYDTESLSRPRRKIKRAKRRHRKLEQQIDGLSNAVMALQNMFVQHAMLDEQSRALSKPRNKSPKMGGKRNTGELTVNTTSETTIYDNVVQKEQSHMNVNVNKEISFNLSKQRQETSSDEQGYTSDEILNVTNQFIADCAAEAERRRSGDVRAESQDGDKNSHSPSLAEQQIHKAEVSKLRIAATPGNISHAVDEVYLVIGGHVDEITKTKIVNHENVDFARLLPKDRIVKEDDHCMELINKGGFTYFIPVAD